MLKRGHLQHTHTVGRDKGCTACDSVLIGKGFLTWLPIPRHCYHNDNITHIKFRAHIYEDKDFTLALIHCSHCNNTYTVVSYLRSVDSWATVGHMWTQTTHIKRIAALYRAGESWSHDMASVLAEWHFKYTQLQCDHDIIISTIKSSHHLNDSQWPTVT